MELAGELEGFRRRGLGLAAISYDSVAVLEDFARRREIPFPLLSDPGSEVIRDFGLLNPEYPEGNDAHGVPYPGLVVMDAEGRVTAKFFEDGYRPRRTAGSVFVLEGDSGEAAQRVGADHFSLTASLSDTTAYPGSRITLVLDFEMEERHHVYAPGEHRYRGLALRLEPDPFLTVHETALPEPVDFHFAPLEETVPVFEGRFRVTQDVTFATGREIAAAIDEEPRRTLSGILEYQVCSDRVCYPPATLPVSWTLTLENLDRERVPEALREHHRD